MQTYTVYLTNPDDQQDAGPSSFTSGRYGFSVRAIGIEHAVDLVVERAKADGFYETDWSAKIVPMTSGHDVGLRLRDGKQPRWVHTAYPVEVLWWPAPPRHALDRGRSLPRDPLPGSSYE
jgi:hypothetical protein